MMYSSTRKKNIITTTALLLFLKPLADMWYQLSVLDYALTGLACVALIINAHRIRHLFFIDAIAFFIVAVLTMTLIRTDFQGAVIYIKMISAFILYFLGRSCGGERLYRERKLLVYSQIIVLLANMLSLITRRGFQAWGHATTFSGFYFFKTDLALAMIYVVVTLFYFSNYRRIPLWIATILCGIMVILSNSRMDILILFILLGIFYLKYRESITGKQLKINLKYTLLGIATLFVGVVVISRLLKLSIFQQFGFISFSFEKIMDLFNASNTSGRSVVWTAILQIFNSKPFAQRFFGIDFVSDYYLTYDSHNAYLKVLFTTGYLGLSLFILFFIIYLINLNSVENRNLFYFNLSLLITFLLQSLSASTVIYTQSTWIFMLFLGASISQQPLPEKRQENWRKIRIKRRTQS